MLLCDSTEFVPVFFPVGFKIECLEDFYFLKECFVIVVYGEVEYFFLCALNMDEYF